MSSIKVEIVSLRGKPVATLDAPVDASIGTIKSILSNNKPKYYPERVAFKLDPKGATLKDAELIGKTSTKLFFKDLGPQVGWDTVFYAEYAGPLFAYLLFYFRPSLIYGEGAANAEYSLSAKVAAWCWVFHYAKRLLETRFVHRFSHATMPIFNLFRNCSYYWGFAAFVSYFINHPLYTPASETMVWIGVIGFLVSEFGNFSIHVAFRNLRPAGTTKRSIPRPTSNPFTKLFNLVSCPNYTYEILIWLFFNIATSFTVAGVLFMLAGTYQMSMWALGKHKNYKKEFGSDYPRSRKAIIPFVL